MRMEKGKTHEKVDTLDNIEEYLVLAISDALRSPRDSIRHCHRWSNLDLELVGFLRDISIIDDTATTSVEYGYVYTHSCKILLSVVCGYPKSIISSMSS